MAGEGRGHATRVKAIVESLRVRHRVVLFASGQAYDLLEPFYAGSGVQIRRIEGLSFCYRGDGKLDYLQTGRESLLKILRLKHWIEEMCDQVRADSPDLVISDFEPLLPRVAKKLGIPFLSIDHQHFLTSYSLRSLPFLQRIKAFLMGLVVSQFYSGQALTVISSFYSPPLRWGKSDVRQVGVLLGQDILNEVPSEENFLLVYLRRETPQRVLRALENCGVPAKIYGPENALAGPNLSFHSLDRAAFVRDLARCRALVSTAGNQVVGEALHLRKPVLVMPEPGNWEQGINGFFVEEMGVGKCHSMLSIRSNSIRSFLENLESHRQAVNVRRPSGNGEVSQIVEDFLIKLQALRGAKIVHLVGGNPSNGEVPS